MLIVPRTLNIKRLNDLPQASMQLIMDFEVMLADMGLVFHMACMQCARVGDDSTCQGNADFAGQSFTVTCSCTEWKYRGDLYVPRTPRPLRKPRLDLAVRPEIDLTREHMAMFTNANTVLCRMKIRYSMRCMACRLENRLTDGVWGSAESTGSEYHVDCACTKRIYRGADAPVPVH